MPGRDENEAGLAGGAGGHTPLLVLGKITEILNAFTLREPSLTLRDIQQATGIPSSTVQRLVTNLVAHGFLDRVDDRFRIGVKMAYWAAAAAREVDVLAVVNPVLKDLRDVTGETACFFRVEGGHRVCIAVAETRHGLRREMSVGRIAPVSVGASGRVLLAWNPDLTEQVLGHELPQLTAGTVTDRDELRKLIKQTAADRYAITVGERVDSASGVAAPVFDSAADLVGAVVVQGRRYGCRTRSASSGSTSSSSTPSASPVRSAAGCRTDAGHSAHGNAVVVVRAPSAVRDRLGSPSSVEHPIGDANQVGQHVRREPAGRSANNRSSVAVLPPAPGANGQPPRPPSAPSTSPLPPRSPRAVGDAEPPGVVPVEHDRPAVRPRTCRPAL